MEDKLHISKHGWASFIAMASENPIAMVHLLISFCMRIGTDNHQHTILLNQYAEDHLDACPFEAVAQLWLYNNAKIWNIKLSYHKCAIICKVLDRPQTPDVESEPKYKMTMQMWPS